MKENWLLLGASRGLGRSFLEKASQPNSAHLKLYQFSRKSENLPGTVSFYPADFSDTSKWELLIQQMSELKPQRIFYFAAGGPFGEFEKKNWKDHQWAFRVTFEFPAFLLHQFLKTPEQLKQIVLIGSAIAENQPDPKASAYCAAKHALRGLVTSVQKENPPLDVRLFSPGYMDTPLLPANAWPRQQGLAEKPEKVAEMLWAWIHNADDANKHFVLQSSS